MQQGIIKKVEVDYYTNTDPVKAAKEGNEIYSYTKKDNRG